MSRGGRRRRRKVAKKVASIHRMGDHPLNLGRGVIMAMVARGSLSAGEAYRILNGRSPVE